MDTNDNLDTIDMDTSVIGSNDNIDTIDMNTNNLDTNDNLDTNNMDASNNNQNTDQKKESFKDRLYTNPVWIVFVLIAWYIFIAEILAYQVEDILPGIWNMSNAEYFIYIYYTITIVSVVVLFLLCLFRKNRYIWKSFLPASRNRSRSNRDGALFSAFPRPRPDRAFLRTALRRSHGDKRL